MELRERLLHELADGRFHSGQRLADALGVSRTAIWKQVQGLARELDLGIDAVRGRGYRLSGPLELLDAARILDGLGGAARRQLEVLHVLGTTDSTNNRAGADLPGESGRARVWLAEHQTAGRGRRGRTWVSTFGENLYLSLAWRFDLPMSQLSGLSLVAGVALAEVLEELGLEGHALKWPNDVLVDGRKLAGVLVDVSGESGGPATAVIGLGVNFRLRTSHARSIDQPWIDLYQASPIPVSRNQMAALLVTRLIGACSLFTRERLEPFLPRWERFDHLRGRRVAVIGGTEAVEGVYHGIAASGAMILEHAEGRSEHHAGEISLRETVR